MTVDPKQNPRVAVLFTGHFYRQGRRGSMHWLADELRDHGWHVRFVTFGYSWLSLLMRDVRLAGVTMPQQGLSNIGPGLETYFALKLFHPINLRNSVLNRLAQPVFERFKDLWEGDVRRLAADADMVVLESGLPVVLARLVKLNSRAKLIYRVNDDVRIMQMPPVVPEAEIAYAALFDRISVASPILARRFAALGCVGLDPMGLDAARFAQQHPSPFNPRWEVEAVCAGTSHFDGQTVLTMADLRPNWRFHILGRLRVHMRAPNIVCHGEKSFDQIVPYVQHADIGLAPYRDRPGVEYQTHHSNRLMQYAALGLPTVGPRRMTHLDAPYLVGYDPGDMASIDAALARAVNLDRTRLSAQVPGWDALYRGIVSVCDQ